MSTRAPAIGIDLGTTQSCVAVFRHGKVEVIANDTGSRLTPSVVTFADTEIFIGEVAVSRADQKPANKIYGESHANFFASLSKIIFGHTQTLNAQSQ